MEKYLPLGTVVLLKNAKKKIMIIGYAVRKKGQNNKIYDYLGCLYPEGAISNDVNLVFNHELIDKIYYMGYNNEESKKVQEFIKSNIE